MYCDCVSLVYRTMAGRRLRDAVQKTLIDSGFPKNVIPVIAGLSNTYADYQTTFEEYQVYIIELEKMYLTFKYIWSLLRESIVVISPYNVSLCFLEQDHTTRSIIC